MVKTVRNTLDNAPNWCNNTPKCHPNYDKEWWLRTLEAVANYPILLGIQRSDP